LKLKFFVLTTILLSFLATVACAVDFYGASVSDKDVPTATWKVGIDGVRPTIVNIIKGSLAEKVGFTKGDIILSINNKDTKKSSDLLKFTDNLLEVHIFSGFTWKTLIIDLHTTKTDRFTVVDAQKNPAVANTHENEDIQGLIQKHGKHKIVNFILNNRDSTITIIVDGAIQETIGTPDDEFVNVRTIRRDLSIIQISSSEVDDKLEDEAVQAAKLKKREKETHKSDVSKTNNPTYRSNDSLQAEKYRLENEMRSQYKEYCRLLRNDIELLQASTESYYKFNMMANSISASSQSDRNNVNYNTRENLNRISTKVQEYKVKCSWY